MLQLKWKQRLRYETTNMFEVCPGARLSVDIGFQAPPFPSHSIAPKALNRLTPWRAGSEGGKSAPRRRRNGWIPTESASAFA